MTIEKKFKILSIDGGGIRGIIPAKVLADLEESLCNKNGRDTKLCEHFDLICGTSTGAILAIAIALGIPAKKIVSLYKDNAEAIFPRWYLKILPRKSRVLTTSIYSNKVLKRLLKQLFTEANGGVTPLINDLKTKVCIPTYNGGMGEINILKTKHCDEYNRDYKLPAHEVALSSASAPVYFPPNSFTYDNELGSGVNINMIDGGVFANNPTLIGIFEATDKLKVKFSDLQVLSLGTGRGRHIVKQSWKPQNFFYWFIPKPRLLDITLDSQAQITEQYIFFLRRTIADQNKAFDYLRVQHDFYSDSIDLNASKKKDLMHLEAIGSELSKKYLTEILTLINK